MKWQPLLLEAQTRRWHFLVRQATRGRFSWSVCSRRTYRRWGSRAHHGMGFWQAKGFESNATRAMKAAERAARGLETKR